MVRGGKDEFAQYFAENDLGALVRVERILKIQWEILNFGAGTAVILIVYRYGWLGFGMAIKIDYNGVAAY